MKWVRADSPGQASSQRSDRHPEGAEGQQDFEERPEGSLWLTQDSKLHSTLNLMAKSNPPSKEHKQVIEMVVSANQVKEVRQTWKQHLQAEGGPENDNGPEELPIEKKVSMDSASTKALELGLKHASSTQTAYSALPDLKDSNRNQCLKRLADEISSPETLDKLREVYPENKFLEPAGLCAFVVLLEKGRAA
jgi:hypothetical protein